MKTIYKMLISMIAISIFASGIVATTVKPASAFTWGTWENIGGPGSKFSPPPNVYIQNDPAGHVYATDSFMHVCLAKDTNCKAYKDATGDIYQYDGTPFSWTQIGGQEKMFATSGGKLYSLSPGGDAIWEYTEMGQWWQIWKKINRPMGTIYGGGLGENARLYATAVIHYKCKLGNENCKAGTSDTGDIYQYGGTPFSWTWIGGPGKMFAVGDNGLYSLSTDGTTIYEYTGTPGAWKQIIKSPTVIEKIFTGGNNLYMMDSNGIVYLEGTTLCNTKGKTYDKGYCVQFKNGHIVKFKDFVASSTNVYGLSVDGEVIKYTPSFGWEDISRPEFYGHIDKIFGGAYGDNLYATSPDTESIWHYNYVTPHPG